MPYTEWFSDYVFYSPELDEIIVGLWVSRYDYEYFLIGGVDE
jgi:hypothetical protein